MSIFCDQTTVEFIAGKGGDGSVHFRREKFVAYGGPDGGDGGRGGSIILETDANLNTLVDFNTKKIFQAEEGDNGQKKLMAGRHGEDLHLKIPAGTILKDAETGDIIADLTNHGVQFTIARGGKGGMGNDHFKSSIHRAPDFAETGEEGEHRKITMELQLVADIGIIGYPSAGKSTLISRISNAKPKIAAYPFTTLIPNLGVLDMRRFDKSLNESFVVADIPGLIEGAHEGKGLGFEFLRHVSRAEGLVHVIDATRDNVVEDYRMINNELQSYDQRLSKKDQIVVINKIDAVDPELIKQYKKDLEKAYKNLKGKVFIMSAVTGEGLKELAFEMFKDVQAFRKKQAVKREVDQRIEETSDSDKVFKPHLEKPKYTIEFKRNKLEAASQKLRGIYDVKGARIEQVVKMTDIENPEGLERIYHFMSKMGIRSQLSRKGAKPGDKIRIAGKTFKMR